jgi:hypothetical protein
MDPKEMRLNNLVLDDIGLVDYVTELDGLQINRFKSEYFHPIPIDGYWLERLGFEKVTNGWPDDSFSAYKIGWMGTGYTYSSGNLFIKTGTTFYRFTKQEIKYIHQLQNLYFALTGQELKDIEND